MSLLYSLFLKRFKLIEIMNYLGNNVRKQINTLMYLHMDP